MLWSVTFDIIPDLLQFWISVKLLGDLGAAMS